MNDPILSLNLIQGFIKFIMDRGGNRPHQSRIDAHRCHHGIETTLAPTAWTAHCAPCCAPLVPHFLVRATLHLFTDEAHISAFILVFLVGP
jgi:hypothetical protein